MTTRTGPPGKVRPPVDESGGREDERLAGGRSVAIFAHPADDAAEAGDRDG